MLRINMLLKAWAPPLLWGPSARGGRSDSVLGARGGHLLRREGPDALSPSAASAAGSAVQRSPWPSSGVGARDAVGAEARATGMYSAGVGS